MASNFDELVAEHLAAHLIPHEDLYAFLVRIRQDLLNEMKLGVDRVPNSPLGKEVRRRCKADLMWMARYFTWMSNPISEGGLKPFEENIFDEQYYRVVNDLFVKKDDTKRINQQSEIKTRMLLWPRGGAKSTYDHVDTVQWILNFPSIRIMYLTATIDLAEGFVGEIKGHFYIKPEDPTWMNIFFSEFCILDDKAGAANVFTCPVYAAKKTGRKEPTVYAASVGKAKAGWRYELIKADDAVSDTNSATSEQCTKISGSLFLAEKVLALGGHYIDYIGTRYADEDHYGVLLDQNIGDNIVKTEGQGWVRYYNPDTQTLILVGKAIQIKSEVKKRLEEQGKSVTYQEAGSDGCIFLLPHLMDFKWCMGDLTKDEKSFEGQRNQNPRPASSVTFDRLLLLKNTIPFSEMPVSGPVSQTWDFAYSSRKGRDYSTGCSIMWGETDELDSKGNKTGNKKTVGYVQEIIRDRFNHATLAKAVVNLALKYRPFVVAVEKTSGADFLTMPIELEAVRSKDLQIYQVCTNIDWFAVDNQKDAKKVRMAALYPWLLEGKLKFLNTCMTDPHGNVGIQAMEKLYTEFEKCLTSHHHDDIPDVISQQPRYAPRATQALIMKNEEMFSRSDPMWNMIFTEGTDQFGRVGFGPAPIPFNPEQEDMSEDEAQVDNYWQFN